MNCPDNCFSPQLRGRQFLPFGFRLPHLDFLPGIVSDHYAGREFSCRRIPADLCLLDRQLHRRCVLRRIIRDRSFVFTWRTKVPVGGIFKLPRCSSRAADFRTPGSWRTLGAALFWTGEFPRARSYLEQGIALYDPQQHRSPAYVTDLGILCRCYAMLVLWSLGYPDQARSMAQDTLSMAYELSHAHSLAQTLSHASFVHQLCREGQATRESAEQAMTLSTEQGFPLWSVTGIIMQAWAFAEQGQIAEGMGRLHQALTAYGTINSSIIYPYFLSLFAEVQRQAARPEEGLATVTEALTKVEQTGARYYEAELWRLKGELLLAQARLPSKEKSDRSSATGGQSS